MVNMQYQMMVMYICDASRKTGINRVNITNCIGGKQKMAGGYIWKKGGDVNHGR